VGGRTGASALRPTSAWVDRATAGSIEGGAEHFGEIDFCKPACGPLDGCGLGHDDQVDDAPAFYARPSLNIETYDTRTDLDAIEGDIVFYLDLARQIGGPVLDLGGGTGRVAWPLADAGLDVTTLDLSAAMLVASRAKASGYDAATRRRLTFVNADMRTFDLSTRFGLAIAPFRVFQALMTPGDQAAALATIHRHLRPGGVFVAHLFDPLLNWCTPMDEPLDHADRGNGRLASSGNTVAVRALHRTNDPLAQVYSERWEFVEVAPDGATVRREEEVLRMRWTYRYEMRYLLELAGFAVEAEYSDFHRSPPRYGAEQVWIARRRND
jgi:SAM-dependent methyltransferase